MREHDACLVLLLAQLHAREVWVAGAVDAQRPSDGVRDRAPVAIDGPQRDRAGRRQPQLDHLFWQRAAENGARTGAARGIASTAEAVCAPPATTSPRSRTNWK